MYSASWGTCSAGVVTSLDYPSFRSARLVTACITPAEPDLVTYDVTSRGLDVNWTNDMQLGSDTFTWSSQGPTRL
jgi:hypothetical protein